jgi:lipid-A-disaccharide synthase-like uncharacterized protein
MTVGLTIQKYRIQYLCSSRGDQPTIPSAFKKQTSSSSAICYLIIEKFLRVAAVFILCHLRPVIQTSELPFTPSNSDFRMNYHKKITEL